MGEDQSGEIDFEEFRKLVHILLRIPAHLHLPEKRVMAFWKEIDQDQSGNVDFEEFLAWYKRQSLSVNAFYAQVRGIAHENARQAANLDQLLRRPGSQPGSSFDGNGGGHRGSNVWLEQSKRSTYVTQQLVQSKGTQYL